VVADYLYSLTEKRRLVTLKDDGKKRRVGERTRQYLLVAQSSCDRSVPLSGEWLKQMHIPIVPYPPPSCNYRMKEEVAGSAVLRYHTTMLSYNDILPKKYIILDGEPYEVLAAHVFRKQQRKPVNQTKLKNLRTGKVVERSFHQSETVEEAGIEKRDALYLYNNRGEWWFCESADRSKRFPLPQTLIGEAARFLTPNSPISIADFKGEPLGVELPIKLDLRVAEAPPAIRGNTAQGANKQVTLEGGAVITVPIFIEQGDIVRVNTETGVYVERVQKQ